MLQMIIAIWFTIDTKIKIEYITMPILAAISVESTSFDISSERTSSIKCLNSSVPGICNQKQFLSNISKKKLIISKIHRPCSTRSVSYLCVRGSKGNSLDTVVLVVGHLHLLVTVEL